MQFFVDSADLQEIEMAKALGLMDGVTTNPSLVAKTGRTLNEVITEIVHVCSGPVSCEVMATDTVGMIHEATQYRKLGEQIVVKIPLTEQGLQAVAHCSREGIPTNVTLCFNATQALVAAKAGATYISPFIGRLDDIGQTGIGLIRDIRQIYNRYQLKTQILAASIRGPLHLRDAALEGADVATLPLNVMQQVIKHPLTDLGLAKFMADAEKIPPNLA